MDTLITVIENIIHKDASLNGHYYSFTEMAKHPTDIGNIFDFLVGPLLDGLIGAAVGLKVFQYRNIIKPIISEKVNIQKHHYPSPQTINTINTLPPPPPPPIPTKIPLSTSTMTSNMIPLPAPFNPFNIKNIH
eukprot:363288_1